MPMAKPAATIEGPSIPKTDIEKPVKKVATEPKAVSPSRSGYGQPLTEYDIRKDKQIGAAGVVQAVVSSAAYGHIVAVTDLQSVESMADLRKWFRAEVDFCLSLIQEKSE